ncbi:MAG: hypothetical protein QNJ70_07760 [Xenococcaceae cyanobacterium MO_207.B15]|nr:hypothetical protein [Xenococcaceae cyanobacterium MO_207.B15]
MTLKLSTAIAAVANDANPEALKLAERHSMKPVFREIQGWLWCEKIGYRKISSPNFLEREDDIDAVWDCTKIPNYCRMNSK